MATKLVKLNNLNKLSDSIDKIGKKTLSVGLLTSKIATYAAKQEYGGVYPVEDEYRARAEAKGIKLGDTISIPSRPFMRYSFEKHHKEWTALFNKAFVKTKNIDTSLKIVGEQVKANIQHYIINPLELPEPVANSWQTIAIKEKDTILRDSGEMLNSVNYEVK